MVYAKEAEIYSNKPTLIDLNNNPELARSTSIFHFPDFILAVRRSASWMSRIILGHCTKDWIFPQLRKRLTNGASQAGRDQTPEKQSNAAGETTVNLDNQFQKAKITHNRNEKNANNGIRVAIAGDMVIWEWSSQTSTNVPFTYASQLRWR